MSHLIFGRRFSLNQLEVPFIKKQWDLSLAVKIKGKPSKLNGNFGNTYMIFMAEFFLFVYNYPGKRKRMISAKRRGSERSVKYFV